MSKSIEFVWKNEEFQYLLEACKEDDAIEKTLKYLNDYNLKILEAGCGSGRVVKYLYDLGYKNISGIELNQNAVNNINQTYSELNIIQGDILNMPYEEKSFDIIISYGVVEHFKEGLDLPLLNLNKMLKKDGLAIITIPSLNKVRQLKTIFYKINPLLPKRDKKEFIYNVFPKKGEFFEYRLTPKEFEKECLNAQFKIIKSIPIAHTAGLYNEFKHLVKLNRRKWKLTETKKGKIVNNIFKLIPFFHNHMHLCVLSK